MRQKKQRRLFLVVALFSVAMLMCSLLLIIMAVLGRSTPATAQQARNRIVYGLPLLPNGFDPHINTSPEAGIPLRSIYDTLLYRDPQTKAFIPGLAESWNISEDGLTYTFRLKTGVKFHDGTPFDANAVAANLDRMTRPDVKSRVSVYLLGPYERYTILDSHTIQLTLTQPYAPFLDALCQVPTAIASPQAIAQHDLAQYQFHQVGTGPFVMVDYIPGDHFTIRRNPDYTWGPTFYRPPAANSVDEVKFRFLIDPATRAPALEANEVQIVGELIPTDVLMFSANSDIRLYPQAIPGLSVQFLMNTKYPPTGSENGQDDKAAIRRALIMATNRAAVVDSVFQQFSPVAYGPLSAITPFYDEKVKSFYNYDPAAALQLLTGAGYSDSDGDKILDQNGNKFTVVMVAPSWGLIPQVVEKIQEQWRELGIELKVKQVPNFISLIEAAKAGNYNLIAYTAYGIEPSLLNAVYLSTGTANWTNYVDGNLDSWLTRATESLDNETRTNMYTAVQNHVMEQALILPVRDWVTLNGARANIGGLSFDAYGWFPLLANLTINEVSDNSPVVVDG